MEDRLLENIGPHAHTFVFSTRPTSVDNLEHNRPRTEAKQNQRVMHNGTRARGYCVVHDRERAMNNHGALDVVCVGV